MMAHKKWLFLLLAGYLLILVAFLHYYILWRSLNVQLGAATLVLAVVCRTPALPARRYGWGIAALVLLLVFCWLPFKNFLFLSVICGLFFAVECFAGRVGLPAVLAVVFSTSVADFAVNLFTFPVRLQLSKLASGILAACGRAAEAEGNVIRCGNTTFAVDPACMGLQMLVASVLAVLMLLIIYQKRYARRLPAGQVLLLLAAVLVLNMAGNLFRITCLVYFALMPGTLGHELMGICCWCLYVLLPAVFLVRRLVQLKGERVFASGAAQAGSSRFLPVYNLMLLAGIIMALALRGHYQPPPGASLNSTLPGYQKTNLPGQVVRFTNSTGLIYVKAIPGFYATEHHPMICWKGSGYAFTSVRQQTVAGHNTYMAQLDQGANRLYTAWWYYNGKRATISQLSWRWDVATGANNYALINITSDSEQKLVQQIVNFTNQYRF